MENKRRISYALPPMAAKNCSVSFQDSNGVGHTVDVTAVSLYEAAAAGLAVLSRAGFIETLPGPNTTLDIEVREAPTRHQLTVKAVRDYAFQSPTSPAEKVKRDRLKALLA